MRKDWEVRLFNNRIGLDVAHYNTIDGPKIFNLPVSEASGYGNFKTNGLKTERQGWEITLNLTPVSLASWLPMGCSDQLGYI